MYYHCEACKKEFVNGTLNFCSHLSRDNFCLRCQRCFETRQARNEHYRLIHWGYCELCEEEFNFFQISQHNRDKHSWRVGCNRHPHTTGASNIDESLWCCSPSRPAQNENIFNQHLNSPTRKSEEYVCPTEGGCGRRFSSWIGLAFHLEGGRCPLGLNQIALYKQPVQQGYMDVDSHPSTPSTGPFGKQPSGLFGKQTFGSSDQQPSGLCDQRLSGFSGTGQLSNLVGTQNASVSTNPSTFSDLFKAISSLRTQQSLFTSEKLTAEQVHEHDSVTLRWIFEQRMDD